MIKDDTLVKVRNRANGSVGYTLDGNKHRKYEPREVKSIPFSELKQLQYSRGGQYALDNLLVVEDKEALDLLNMAVEPEYFYDEDSIKDMLLNKSIDAFADFLDFAPIGAIDIAKDLAVKLEIPDVRKRDMLSEKTGLNISNAIMVNKVMNEDTEEKAEVPKQRRVQIEEDKPVVKERRTEVPVSKIVIKK